jgi:hypothetical protein
MLFEYVLVAAVFGSAAMAARPLEIRNVRSIPSRFPRITIFSPQKTRNANYTSSNQVTHVHPGPQTTYQGMICNQVNVTEAVSTYITSGNATVSACSQTCQGNPSCASFLWQSTTNSCKLFGLPASQIISSTPGTDLWVAYDRSCQVASS